MRILDAERTAPLVVLVSSLALLAGCGGTTVFSGRGPVAVTGDLPAPPPPPAPKPPEPPPKVVVRDNKIEITEKIQFEYNKATILPQSFELMDEIAATIKKNPQIKKIAIEGHASSEGDPKHNLKLSDERAKAVMTYLVDKGGVPAAELVAKGYGSERPLVDDTKGTDEEKNAAREKNRRVEFSILDQDVTKKKVAVDAKTGKETVIETKTLSERKEGAAPSAAKKGNDAAKDAKGTSTSVPKKPAAEKSPAKKKDDAKVDKK